MNSPKVSIIVPVYNAEKYLRRCVDSILAQTFTDFECILIDDCSPDKCPEICDEYKKIDDRIKTLHKTENTGPVATRKTGIENATGDFIQFVDSDDWIEPEMTERLYKRALSENLDIVCCDFAYYDINGIKHTSVPFDVRCMDKESICKMLFKTTIWRAFVPDYLQGDYLAMLGMENITMPKIWCLLCNYS
ncbi:MAG: glycosyltransferase [Treponema sp.]|nr:glycosyltransferase [Treponema sp.]